MTEKPVNTATLCQSQKNARHPALNSEGSLANFNKYMLMFYLFDFRINKINPITLLEFY